MAAHSNMEETWGIAATHAEHHIDDYIRYSVEGQTRTGTIIWICAPADQVSQLRAVRYVVQPDEGARGPDLVCPGSILISEAQKQQAQTNIGTMSGELEQELIDILATLSIPIIMIVEIDDNGHPFYVWRIGASTLQQPFGLYVGADRQLIDALKHALERLIKHLGKQL